MIRVLAASSISSLGVGVIATLDECAGVALDDPGIEPHPVIKTSVMRSKGKKRFIFADASWLVFTGPLSKVVKF